MQAGIAPQRTLRPTEEGTVLANTRRSRGPRPRDGAASAVPGAGESTASAAVAVDHDETAVAEPPPTVSEGTPPRLRVTSWADLWSRIRAILARDAVWVPLTVFLLSRAYVFLLGAIAMQINLALPPVAALQYFMPEMAGAAHYLLQPWRNWDGHWYALVVLKGYGYHEAVTAFFPLYPALLGVGNWLLDGQIELAGVLISNIAFLGALFLLYQLLIIDFDRAVVRRALLYIALFPTAYYFSAVYSESLFLLVSVGCLLAARRDRWWIAGALGFLAALTRSHGILLVIPLALLFVKQQGWHPLRWRRNPVPIALVPGGLMVYFIYLGRIWNDPLITLQAQKGWDRYSANPIQALQAGADAVNGCAVSDWNAIWLGRTVDFCWADRIKAAPTLATLRDPLWRWALSESNFVEFAATIFMIIVAVAAFRYLPLAYSAYLAAGIILPLWSPSAVHPLMSMHRFALALFPLFIVLALVAKWRPVHVAWLVISTLLLAFFTIQFASWLWVA
ncbi:MAG: mannosyltransferase family protein [Thermomicrobiales bacterium]